MTSMQLRVAHAHALTAEVRLIRLESTDGAPLPTFEPGAHLVLQLPVLDEVLARSYSLVSDAAEGRYYEIAVKKHPHSGGGSAYLHDVAAIGTTLTASGPSSEFSIVADARHHVLVAGGIGITPMVGIAARLDGTDASYELHYSAKRREAMVLLDRLPRHASLYATCGGSFRRMDVEALVATHASDPGTHFYLCGPSTLVDRARLVAASLGVARQRVHFESFGPAWAYSDGTVTLALSGSGVTLEVDPGTTLLDAMEASGAWVASDCRRGECGACITGYSSGTPIHRDYCLSEADRLHSFCPCVSWAVPGAPLTVAL